MVYGSKEIMDILALDFDGVICNSASEAAVAGWRGAARLWPHRFKGDLPDDVFEWFLQVRPVMETGYESMLLIRLLKDGHSVADILENAGALFKWLIRDESLVKDELVNVFGQTRDAWIADDLQGWLNMHAFYDGTVTSVNQALVPVYIITTKEKRFAKLLCDDVNFQIPTKRIFDLKSGPKHQVLAKLSRWHKHARIHFVEDRLQTLIQMMDVIDFDVRFYLADWGYNTTAQCDLAGGMPAINILRQDQFPQFVRNL